MEIGIQTDVSPAKKIVVINRGIEDKLKKRMVRKRTLKEISGATPDIKQRWRIYKTYDEPYLFRNIGIEDDLADQLERAFDESTDIEKVLKSFKQGRVVGTMSDFKDGDGGGSGYSRSDLLSMAFNSDIFNTDEARAFFGRSGSRAIDSSRVAGSGLQNEVSMDINDIVAMMEGTRRGQGRQISQREVRGLASEGGNVQGNILADSAVASIGGIGLRNTQARQASRFGDMNLNTVLGNMLVRAGIRGEERELRFPSSRAGSGSATPSRRTGSATPVARAGGASTGLSSAQTRQASRGVSGTATPYSRYGISGGLRTGDRMRNVLK